MSVSSSMLHQCSFRQQHCFVMKFTTSPRRAKASCRIARRVKTVVVGGVGALLVDMVGIVSNKEVVVQGVVESGPTVEHSFGLSKHLKDSRMTLLSFVWRLLWLQENGPRKGWWPGVL